MSSQLGVIARRQAIGHGMSERMIQKRLESGAWIAIHPGVYVAAGIQIGWEQRLIAAHLYGGDETAISHRAAAAWWELPGGAKIVELTTPRRISLKGVIVHRGQLDRSQTRRRQAISVTDPTRTLCDLGSVVSADVLEDAVDAAVARASRLFLISNADLTPCHAAGFEDVVR